MDLGADCSAPGDYRERSQRQQHDGFVVRVAALGRCESERVFGVALNDINVQPVWLQIESFSQEPHWLFPTSIDADYFPTYEVARRAAAVSRFNVETLYARYVKDEMKWFVPPASVVSGFIFTHSDEGLKAINIQLAGSNNAKVFNFVVAVPGLPSTYFDLQQGAQDQVVTEDFHSNDQLRTWLRHLVCCANNAEGVMGDPLNLVLVGSLARLRGALIAQRWDVSAPINSASLRRMVTAFLFGSRFRYAPVSPLYLFGREQDLSFQKARAIIDERNHMRLWRAPVTLRGAPVWVGQVSRDVGIKLTGKLWPPTTHIIDPDVDDARFYVLQNLIGAEAVSALGFVEGIPPASLQAPHYNAEHDPFFTDGLRNVMILADRRVLPEEIQLLDWTLPAVMVPYRNYYLRPSARLPAASGGSNEN